MIKLLLVYFALTLPFIWYTRDCSSATHILHSSLKIKVIALKLRKFYLNNSEEFGQTHNYHPIGKYRQL